MARRVVQHGELVKRKSGGVLKWLARYYDGDVRRAKTLGAVSTMTKTAAEEELRKLVQPVNERNGSVEYTLQGFARQQVFPWYRRSWKESTAMTTVDRIDHHLLKELGNKTLSWFTRNNLQDWLDHKAASGLSHATVLHLRWDLQQLFRMAVNDGHLGRNPAELLHAPKGKRAEKRVLTQEQLSLIISVLDVRERLIVKLAGVCGLRPGEIVGLQWGDEQPDGLHITRAIYRGIIQTPKSTNSERLAALPTSVREDLDTWRGMAPNTDAEDWIFPSENGNTPLWANNAWYDKIRPTLEKLTLGWVNYQVLRRTAVTLLNANGADGSIVAAQMGHTVDVSTNVYNKVGIKRQLAAVQALDNILQRPASLA